MSEEDLIPAVMALAGRRVVALTGAGASTESGIPDYRGPVTRQRARNPMRFAQFVAGDEARRRYWARATIGWPRVRDAAPNDAHRALAAWEERGLVGVVTQNVDSLHSRAGARRVVELHGALRVVRCLDCGARVEREAVHARLLAANPGFAARVGAASPSAKTPSTPSTPSMPSSLSTPSTPSSLSTPASTTVDGVAAHAPDGDVDLPDHVVAGFVVVACDACGGVLKPDVVYFGENVDPRVLADARAAFADADALLVVGSSLEVFSGRRFVEEAARRRMPIVVVNVGPTRSDALATVRVDARAGDVLPRLAAACAR